MNIELTADELAFQQQVRTFFTTEYPQHIREKVMAGIELEKNDFVEGQKALYAKGWAADNWPVEHGGTGWTPTQKYLFHRERARAAVPPTLPFGMGMVAPVIYHFGNEEQQKRFLPDILASNVWWCQGYSEPGAGSDLASLKTTAVRDGDEFVVNGTKTWTTLGQFADWIFCLVRTDSSVAKRQEGISFLLIDMNNPGISVSPILTLDGRREVNEVHFDDVRVPANNLIGEEGKGWTYAKLLLTHERTGIAGVATSQVRIERLKKIASETQMGGESLMNDPIFAAKVADIETDLMALEYTELRTLAQLESGKAPGPESSILKIKGTEIDQAICELMVEAAGYYSLPFVKEQFEQGFDGEYVGPFSLTDAAPHYFNNRKVSIYGGTNEIQKNIISKAVLGL